MVTPAAPKPERRRKTQPGPGTAVINAVIVRDKGICVISGPHCTGDAQTADHCAGRGHGGSRVLNDPRLLVAACNVCNGWKEEATGWQREELIRRRIRIEKAATNEETARRGVNLPVLYPDGVWRWILSATETSRVNPDIPF